MKYEIMIKIGDELIKPAAFSNRIPANYSEIIDSKRGAEHNKMKIKTMMKESEIDKFPVVVRMHKDEAVIKEKIEKLVKQNEKKPVPQAISIPDDVDPLGTM